MGISLERGHDTAYVTRVNPVWRAGRDGGSVMANGVAPESLPSLLPTPGGGG